MIRSLLLILGLLLSLSVSASAVDQGFTPCVLGNAGSPPVTLSVSNTSSNVQLAVCGPTVILMNITSQEAFFNLGSTSSVTATTSSFSLPGNSFIQLTVPTGAIGYYLAAITSTSTTTIRILQGIAQ